MNNAFGHGHVYPRPDGVKARCGGPGLCLTCNREQHEKDMDEMSQPHPQEHRDVDDFADKVEASAYDKLRKPLGYVTPEMIRLFATHGKFASTGTFYVREPRENEVAIYTQPQVDALIAKARADARRDEKFRCLNIATEHDERATRLYNKAAHDQTKSAAISASNMARGIWNDISSDYQLKAKDD